MLLIGKIGPLVDGGCVTKSLIGERILERLEHIGISQAELARRSGLAQSTVNALVNGTSRTSAHLHVIAKELGVSTAWLAGDMDAPAPGSDAVLSPALLAEQLDAVMIPEVRVSFSMGGGSVLEDWPEVGRVPLSREWLRGLTRSSPEQIFVVRGDGDSMMPTILDQDLVIVDSAQRTIQQQDRLWALAYGNVGMIKRVRALPDGSYQVNSDNPAVSPIHAADDEMHVVGRVVGIVRRI